MGSREKKEAKDGKWQNEGEKKSKSICIALLLFVVIGIIPVDP